jgi:hypothetical protein
MTNASEGLSWNTLQQVNATYLHVITTFVIDRIKSENIFVEQERESLRGHSALV